MNPRIKLATSPTPDGGEMILYKHGCDFLIRINGQDLMHSRQHESELELARLGCAHLAGTKAPRILIGGLGMGYTLGQTLDMLGPHAQVTVAELLGSVVDWNREYFGELNGQALYDERVQVKTGDIMTLISGAKEAFHTILLDIDNGPNAMTEASNHLLYTREGIRACQQALQEKGCLAVWSAEPDKGFEQRLMRCSFHVRRFRVPVYKGAKSGSRFIWVASENKNILPSGGGEPRLPIKKESRGFPRHKRKRQYV